MHRLTDAIKNWLRAIADNLALAIVTLVTIVVLTLSFGWTLWGILSGESTASDRERERERQERERQAKEAAEREARLAAERASAQAEQDYRETAIRAAAEAKRRCDPVDVANGWLGGGKGSGSRSKD